MPKKQRTKVLLLGSTGMLGRYVYSILSNNYQIDLECPDRDRVNGRLKNIESGFQVPHVIVNCIGAIPQRPKPNNANWESDYMWQANTALPREISRLAKEKDFKYIHITTDCVFSGKKGKYTPWDYHDSDEAYGLTKSLGETKDDCIIRTSIIGLAPQHGKGLLEWVISQRGRRVKGFTNHIWNGITTLTLAHEIHRIIVCKDYWQGVRHYYSESMSKYELVKLIDTVWGLKLIIEPYEHDLSIDRTLDKGVKCTESMLSQLNKLKQFVLL